MMITTLQTAILMLAIVPLALNGQTQPATAYASCIKSLELPTRGLLAARAGTSGTVGAVVFVGKDGKIEKLDLTGGNNILQAEVRVAMELSSFDGACQGKRIPLTFDFTLTDPPTDNILPPAVKFVPPSRFELTFRRVKPNID
jgi:hypothetical protein